MAIRLSKLGPKYTLTQQKLIVNIKSETKTKMFIIKNQETKNSQKHHNYSRPLFILKILPQ